MKTTTLVAALLLAACASAPPPAGPPPVSPEQKTAWILQLEHTRALKFELPPPPAPPVVRGRRAAPPPPKPSSSPDLAVLVTDSEPRVRRRAALAVGRVGLPEGVPILLPLVVDPDPEVRQMAAFALGLIAVALEDGPSQPHSSLAPAVPPLTGALTDADPRVRGRAAEALGQIGAQTAAPAIGQLAAEYARTPSVTGMQPDDETWPGPPEAAAFRLAVFALVRLRAYEPLAAAVLDSNGEPVTAWWPVAFALQRVGDPRAVPALLALLKTPGRYTASFAARGLGAAKAPAAVAPLVERLDPKRHPLEVVVSAIRAVGAIGDPAAATPLARLAAATGVDPNIRLEAVGALTALRTSDALPTVQDLLTDPWPALRAAALRAAATIDREGFVLLLSALDPDSQWTVRAATADVLATLPPEIALPRVRSMLGDEDRRVVPAVLSALARLKAPDIDEILLARAKDPDPGIREAAVRHLGMRTVPGGADALREAYQAGRSEATSGFRAAALVALASYGAEATGTLKAALQDPDWAIRLRAAQLLSTVEPGAGYAHAIRPAPGDPPGRYDDPQMISPPNSPHAFIETTKGTIEIELAVLDAPQTARNFMNLARKGFFNGLAIHRVVPNFVVQDGDPRGDGNGGPGYTIRDELNDRPYLRGTVGMALSRRDDGGSQFFITHSPQPHLDGRYTAFAHVVSGMDVVDRIQQGDVIQRIQIWDGKTLE